MIPQKVQPFIWLAISIFLSVVWLFGRPGTANDTVDKITLKCPEAYATKEDYEKALTEYIASFTKNNLTTTLKDVIKDHVRFLTENNCQETLANIRNKAEATGPLY